MSEDHPTISLTNLKGGLAAEMFDAELQRVWSNIADPQTDPEAAREIQLKVKFKPSDQRGVVDIKVTANTKLAPAEPVETTAYLENEQGKFVGKEATPV